MPLEYGIAQHDGYKSPSEDFVAHIVCPNKYEIFGVFDGHNTNYYSKEASVRLPKILSDKFNHNLSNEEIVNIIEDAFQQMQKELTGPQQGGTTACIVIITETDIIVASIGDSMTLYYDKKGDLIYSTQIHNKTNPKECTRVEKSGGKLFLDQDGELRINGKLELTRSFGDKSYNRNVITCIPEIKILKRIDGYIALFSDSFTESNQYSFLFEHFIKVRDPLSVLSQFLFNFIGQDLSVSAKKAVTAQVNKFKRLFVNTYYGDNTSLIYIKV